MANNSIINYDKFASSDVKKYLKECENWLSDRFGENNVTWKSSLMMLAQSLEMYLALKADIDKRGYVIVRNGVPRPNPCIKDLLAYQVRIEQQTKVLGLTPYAQTLLKTNKADDTQLELDFLMGNVEPGTLRVAQ